jgi:hypothetical protein
VRNNWKLEPAQRNAAFNGFHRAVTPEVLKGR